MSTKNGVVKKGRPHCKNCKRPDHEKPMVFRGEDWCSDNCRKALGRGPKDAYNGRTA